MLTATKESKQEQECDAKGGGPITFRGYECFPVVLTPSSDSTIFTPGGTQRMAINWEKKVKALRFTLQICPVSHIEV